MSYNYSNSSYETLSRIGTGANPRNSIKITTAESDIVGVNMEQSAIKKAVSMEIVVPIRRSGKGSRRAARLSLTGRQARELYESLQRFYENRTEE